MKEPCYCGALDCPRCYPSLYKHAIIDLAHEEHQDPTILPQDCLECQQLFEPLDQE